MKWLIYGCLLFSSTTIAQDLPIDPDSKKATYTSVVSVDSADASQLFSRAQGYIARTFVSANDVVQSKDEVGKTIIGKGNFSLPNKGLSQMGWVNFTITIQAKDGRYKLILTDFSHENIIPGKGTYSGGAIEDEKPDCGGFWMPAKYWKDVKEKCAAKARYFDNELKKAMSNSAAKDNW